jgi:hypothetical protein
MRNNKVLYLLLGIVIGGAVSLGLGAGWWFVRGMPFMMDGGRFPGARVPMMPFYGTHMMGWLPGIGWLAMALGWLVPVGLLIAGVVLLARLSRRDTHVEKPPEPPAE